MYLSDKPEIDQVAFVEDFGDVAEAIANCEDSGSLTILIELAQARLDDLNGMEADEARWERAHY